MVLENAQADSIPPTGVEPTNDSDNTPNTKYQYHSLYIKRDLIANPDPFTLYFGFFGRWNYDRKVTANVLRRVENARVLIQRLPTQDELDAMVTHSSRSLYQERIGAPLGGLVGSGLLWMQARKSELFPAYFPKASGPEGKMPSPGEIVQAAKRFVAAEPTIARRAIFVTGFKLLFYSVAGATFSSIYAVYKETTNTMADSRLKEFLADLKKQNPEELRRRQMESRGRRSVGEQQGVVEMNQGGDYASEYSGGDVQSTGVSGPDRPPVAEPVSLGGGLGADQARGGDFFDEDDASPTAPEYRTNRGAQAGYSQGSAWERIRQQNASAPSIQSSRQDTSNQQSPQWDSWSPPSSESDKQREREQARAEFERLLDAERNIGQESASEARNKGWGKWN
ncbi:hypothetical protein BDV27DRAFT_131619 [Aspergillus caelatus]|uniref:Endo-1,3(4)-beta-glucanase n=1 Tax=Aspergillus caelatus TaxID=61420 RepID=A0A5N6ZY62_9EURO|nr:uncharacterized protein BDV27DRAFT_131619 [Aspergillus caelatus]KAE8362355.1 hypothetical protein BDV27DRAFT_131619 [Aspergillus caelatus]